MLFERPIGNCICEVFRVADSRRYVDPQCRVIPADVVEHPGQILLQMPALPKEQRDDGYVRDALGCQSGDGRVEGGLHHFQESQFNPRTGLLVPQSRHDPAEWLRPRRVAGTVGKQKDGRSRCLVHAKNERSCILASVADWETGRSGAAG